MRTMLSLPKIGETMRLRTGAAIVLTALLTGCSAAAPVPTAVPPAAQQANVATPGAPKPADATLKIVSPKPGEMIDAGQVRVAVAYTGPSLVPAAQAKRLDDYHLHYFLDEDATPYIGSSLPIPAGRPSIVHSAASEVAFDNVSAGSHTLTVVMTGNNHISVEAPLSDRVSFTAR